MIDGKIVVADSHAMPWNESPIQQINQSTYNKVLLDDPDTGMGVKLIRYPAGLVNPHHTHPCGHGIYVLEGTLVTHRGNFGPGTFVWFPEGEHMEHGATADGDVIALFIHNKPFRIDYVEEVDR